MKKGYYREFHRSLDRKMKMFHSLIIRMCNYLNANYGSDRVWMLERVKPGGWHNEITTLQLIFGFKWKPETIARWEAEDELRHKKLLEKAKANGDPLPDFMPGEYDSGSMIFASPYGGNVGWPILSNNEAMYSLYDDFLNQFSDKRLSQSYGFDFFPFNTSYSSLEELKFKLDINNV